jgi:integrase
MSQTRRLAAILADDVAGCLRLKRSDETADPQFAAAATAVAAPSIRPNRLIGSRRGRIGILVEFPDGPAFPQVAVNERLGTRSHNAGGHLDKCIKETCGIKRKGVSFHVFRHTIKSALRGSHPESKDNRDYLTGHAPESVRDTYGKFPALRRIIESLPADPLQWNFDE